MAVESEGAAVVSAGAGRVRVGIVGAGIAGSAAAHFAREALGGAADLVVFERAPRVGGRVQTLAIGGLQVEAGASIYHSANRYLAGFADRLGLQPVATQKREEHHAPRTFGVWDGRAFALRSAPSAWRTQAGLLLRYGRTLPRVARLVRDVVERLDRLYALQGAGRAFTTPEAMLRSVGLYDLTQQTSADFFRARGVADRFVREFADGVSRANYGQDASLQAFANLVSLAGAGFAGKLYSIRDGNDQLCRGLLRIAAARVRTDTGVRAIVRWPAADGAPPRYAVATAGGGAETFDAVIVATPLEAADIAFEGIEPPEAAHPRSAYQVTHVTFVVGRLNPAYFGARRAADLPGAILTVEDPAIPFSSIGALGRAADAGHTVYKIFSREPVGERLLSALFAERAQTERLAWRAYPVLAPLPLWPPFRLGHGLYYVNAMESAVSTMETEALASRNVVHLLLQDCSAAGC